MGVDYYTCVVCGRNYPDCGPTYSCYVWDAETKKVGGCEQIFCSKKCAEPKGEDDTLSCISCRDELTNDETLLSFLLAKFGLTREAVAAECVATRKAEAAVELPGGDKP